MPDEGPGIKAELHSGVLQPPAEVDVIAGGVEAGVEAAEFLERTFAHHQIAARQMFGGGVVEHHMTGSARCGADHGLPPVRGALRQVGSADCSVIRVGFKEVVDALQPVAIGLAVIVGIGEDLGLGPLCARVAGRAQSAVLGAHQYDFGKALTDELRRAVVGAIIDHDDLKALMNSGRQQCTQAAADALPPVAGADDGRHHGAE